ncbi:IS110 family transposase [Chloroflexota bacterium]
MKKNRNLRKQKVIELDALEQINLNAAGLDIGAEEIYAAVPTGRDEESVRSYPTFTADLHHLADWLEDCEIETVAMESTGPYWIPIYEILESRGLEVYLVNARHIKNVSGRKTDVLDCQWIQQLHTYGLLSPSFRPPDQICAIRSLVRHREMLIRYRSSHIQHMQKELNLMNLKLTNVLSDITGVTGMKIIRAIVAGEHNPEVLARFWDRRCAHSEADIVKSLEGHYKREHLFALKQALELYDFYDQQLKSCDAELEALYAEFDPPQNPGTPPPQPRKRKRRKNQPDFDLSQSLHRMTGVDLTQVDGLDAMSAQTILSEIGIDMSPWKTVKHFASWLHLSPNNMVTGGKVKRRSTQPTQNRASTTFRVAAQSLARSDSALGAFYHRIRAKHGAPKAITATAHKLAHIVYFMLKNCEPYRDPGASYFERQHRDRVLRNLQRKATKFGFRLVPVVST